jgi:hypothetical protein
LSKWQALGPKQFGNLNALGCISPRNERQSFSFHLPACGGVGCLSEPAPSLDRPAPRRAVALDHSSASDKLVNYGDDGKYQQQMDQASSDMKHGEAEQPKYKQYYCNCPNYDGGLYEMNLMTTNAQAAI